MYLWIGTLEKIFATSFTGFALKDGRLKKSKLQFFLQILFHFQTLPVLSFAKLFALFFLLALISMRKEIEQIFN